MTWAGRVEIRGNRELLSIREETERESRASSTGRKDIGNSIPHAVTMRSFQHSGIRSSPAVLKRAGKQGMNPCEGREKQQGGL